MKVVIDTNVLISAAIRDRDPEAVVLFVVEQPDIEWVVSPEILQEYHEVLARPRFGLSTADYEEWQALLRASTTLVTIHADLEFPRDPKDVHFLACCLASRADYFVTGDLDFSAVQELLPTKIVSVATFKKQVMTR